jgi:glycosyltransferase involved in cell wall biosynthesis
MKRPEGVPIVPMRIAHYGISLWLNGGVASYVRRIAATQRTAGHDVFFFDDRPGDPTTSAEWRAQAVDSDAELYASAMALDVDILHLHSTVSLAPPAGLKTIRTVHTNEPYCISSLQYLKRSGRPCPHAAGVRCIAGHLLEHCGSLRPQKLLRTWKTFRSERRVLPGMRALAVSQFMMQRLLDGGYPAGNVALLRPIPPYSPQFVPPPAEGIPRFAFLSRLVPEKGAQWLLRAWKQLDCPAHLDIAGSGYYEADLRSQMERLGLADRVTFHGWLDQARAATLIAGSRAVIFPSLWQEPSGTVVFEAMANGRATIVSDVGGACEPVEAGVSALVVAPGDEQGMVRAVRALAEDHTLASRLGASARERLLGNFGIEDHMGQLYRHYREVIAA